MLSINTQSRKSLVISLIKDDLIHSKLVAGLEALGLDALHFHLHLSETVFELLGIPANDNTEPIYEYYLQALKKARRMNLRKNRDQFDALAFSIYQELERRHPHGK